ncbi:MAG: adenylyl-sulfate kinase [Myxococcota bacterium]
MIPGPERASVIWFTGLPCAGKSTLAEALARVLSARGHRVEILDGDVVRRQLCAGLGYSRSDRDTNVQRIGFVAELLARNGVDVLVAAVSPFEAARRELRQRIQNFLEVHVDCPLDECERRDVKGMYALARAGKIEDFTGIGSPYEAPPNPHIRIDTLRQSVAECVATILKTLDERTESHATGEPSYEHESVQKPHFPRSDRGVEPRPISRSGTRTAHATSDFEPEHPRRARLALGRTRTSRGAS